LALLLSVPARAHHVMDGAMPTSWFEGLLSGLGHPVIGLDHLAFVIAVGLLSSRFARGWLLPLPFLAGTLAGAFVHLGGTDLPAVEALIALSVLVLGLLLALGARIPLGAAAALLLAAGLAHGYAYAESIIGAEPAPLLAYGIGFLVIQYAIAATAWAAARVISQRPGVNVDPLVRGAGALIGVFGAVTLALAA